MKRSLFKPVTKPEKLDKHFQAVSTLQTYSAARKLMDEVFTDFTDIDGSFIREFQTEGFSPRLFELALYAYLREHGYALDRSGPAPDFVHHGDMPFGIEVTTTNPPQNVKDDPADDAAVQKLLPEDMSESGREFVFQIGKALRRKLLKRNKDNQAYWEQENMTKVPFVIAVAAFHDGYAQMHPLGHITEYLYGRTDQATYDKFGNLTLTPVKVESHEYDGKKIPSGLFAQPEARNLAGVIFTNSHTISKFNRIGTEKGYGPPDVAILRFGYTYDPDPDASVPLEFVYVVEEKPSEPETFTEGLDLFINPYAENPLNPKALRGLNVNVLLENGLLETTFSNVWRPFASKTINLSGPNAYVHAYLKMCRMIGELPGYH